MGAQLLEVAHGELNPISNQWPTCLFLAICYCFKQNMGSEQNSDGQAAGFDLVTTSACIHIDKHMYVCTHVCYVVLFSANEF